MRQSSPSTSTPSLRPGMIEVSFTSVLRAGGCAQRIMEGFVRYDAAFNAVTKRAPERFLLRDWQGSQLDAAERDELYDRSVAQVIADIRTTFGELVHQQDFWQDVKRHFASLVDGLPESELSKVFFNSVTRGFKTAGINSTVEFVTTRLNLLTHVRKFLALRRIAYQGSMQLSVTQLLRTIPLEADWQDIDSSTEQLAALLTAKLPRNMAVFETLQLLDTVFYQFTRAYAIGSLVGSGLEFPFALELNNTDTGVRIENVMLGRTEVGRLLSLTHSCFHVELDHVTDTAAYLKILAPQLSMSELFSILGRPIQTSPDIALS